MSNSIDLDLVRLNLVPGMTPRATVVLMEAFGSAGAALGAGAAAVRGLPAVGPALAARLDAPPSETDARREARRARRRGIRIVHPGGDSYPELLRETPDPPPVLYARGAPSGTEGVAIVGARRATVYGRVQAERFAGGIARAGIPVISGLARGVDGAAHRGALDARGPTTAVLGCGVDRIYPREHRALAKEIVESGGVLLSEFPIGTPPLSHHFPRRNRIIAGLSRGILIIEGKLKSGSMITARLGNECGRLVFALPGRVEAELARGPHALIRDGAILATSPEEVLEDLGYRPLEAPDPAPPPDDPLGRAILEVLSLTETVGMDGILERVAGETPAILAALTELELAGRVRAEPGRRFRRSGE